MTSPHPAHDEGLALRSPALERLGVPHAFTTRRGPGGRRLDLTHVEGRALTDLVELLGAGAVDVASVRQVHGGRVVEVGREPLAPDTEADALVTATPGRALLVRTADCVPVLLASAGGARVAAVHAGWRGLVAGILPRALEVLGGTDVVAAIGPCLGVARFEVGEEVAEAFRAADLGAAVCDSGPGKPHVDLALAARLQLERGGARELEDLARCTWEDPDLDSYRRDVTHGGATSTGRLGACIAVRGVGQGA